MSPRGDGHDRGRLSSATRQPSVLKRAKSSFFGITARQLLSINEDGQTKENLENLQEIGGVEELAHLLHSDPHTGIDPKRLHQRGEEFGHNYMPAPEAKTWLELFFASFNDTTLIILIVSAIVSLAVGVYGDPAKGWIEGTAILTAVLVVAMVTATNDYSKDKQFRALNAIKDNITVQVIRGGERAQISTTEVLVGDVVLLECGDKVPADGVLIRGADVAANESSLTGEPEDVRKGGGAGEDPFLLSGCVLTGGSCSMLVIAVGDQSRWGRIRAKLQEEPSDTPLQEKLDLMAQQIGYIGMAAAAATFFATLAVHFLNPGRTIDSDTLGQRVDTHFEHVLHAFIIAVTIVVVAVPEGLPLAVTISLAYSTKKMLNDNNLIRVLSACETMGNATNICSDKTGTLTENRMTVVTGWFGGVQGGSASGAAAGHVVPAALSEAAVAVLAEGVAVNTTAWLKREAPEATGANGGAGAAAAVVVVGSKTEGALLVMIEDTGVDTLQLRGKAFNMERGDKVFTFSSARKRMTSLIHVAGGGQRVYCKGAAEIVLGLCTSRLDADGGKVPMTDRDRAEVLRLIESYGSAALRAVGLAHRDISAADAFNAATAQAEDLEQGLTLDCVVGIKDPLRADVAGAVAQCQSAGIMVRMVTGDNVATARAIARECGILTGDGVAMEGPEFRKLSPRALDALLPRLQVLARSSPQDKYLLVSRLNGHGLPRDQAEWEELHPELDWATHKDTVLPGYFEEWSATRPYGGEVVGATGDGTNDAPALKTADVGLSMGLSGTDVAKDASDIVIMDDNFSSIVKAVLWGRCVFDNIRKFLQFQLTVNVVALTVTFMGAVTGYEPPLNAIMMLWVNLIMDTMGALALGTEAPTRALLSRLPLKRTASLVSALMWRHIALQSAYQLALLSWLLLRGARAYGCVDGEERHFTIIFNAFVFCQLFNEFNARSIGNNWNVLSGLSRNPMFQAVILFTALSQFVIVQYGGDFTKTEALTLDEWIGTVLMGAVALPLGALMRLLPPRTETPSDYCGYHELQRTARAAAAAEVASPSRHGAAAKTPSAGAAALAALLRAEAAAALAAPLVGIAWYAAAKGGWDPPAPVAAAMEALHVAARTRLGLK